MVIRSSRVAQGSASFPRRPTTTPWPGAPPEPARSQIEARAAEFWQRDGLAPGFDVERLLDELELDLLWEEVDDPPDAEVLGQLVPARKLVVLNERHRTRLEQNGGRQRRYT